MADCCSISPVVALIYEAKQPDKQLFPLSINCFKKTIPSATIYSKAKIFIVASFFRRSRSLTFLADLPAIYRTILFFFYCKDGTRPT
jgi:hypothetical protein